MQTVCLLVGVPGSGKTWLLDHLSPDKFAIIRNDDYIGRSHDYLADILTAARSGDRPVICEIPFSMSMVTVPLGDAGVPMKAVYLIEHPNELAFRWHERGTKASAKAGHITRQQTYLDRAQQSGAPHGTSAEMLAYLSQLP